MIYIWDVVEKSRQDQEDTDSEEEDTESEEDSNSQYEETEESREEWLFHYLWINSSFMSKCNKAYVTSKCVL